MKYYLATTAFTASGNADPLAEAKRVFYEKLSIAAKNSDSPTLAAIINEGFKIGINPQDLLIRVLQPSLYEIGRLWENADITVTDEHNFTTYTNSIIDLVFANYSDTEAFRNVSAPSIFLVLAENNRHLLGLKIIDFLLATRHISTFACYHSLSSQQVFDQHQKLKPQCVGISVALPEQMPSVFCLRKLFNEMGHNVGIAVGGYAVKNGVMIDPSLQIDICRDIGELLHLLD